jgi:hypothetical protein
MFFYAENFQKLHESGGSIRQYIIFPSAEGEMIPKWFNHQCRGTTFPFWFRNNFPFIMIFFSTDSETYYGSDLDESGLVESSPVLSFNLCINDFERNVAVKRLWMPPSHTLFFNLSMQLEIDFNGRHLSGELMPKLDEAFEKNEWIHAEIKCEFIDTFHLYFKEENNVDHIRFSNPNSISQSQPLLKKQRLLDVGDFTKPYKRRKFKIARRGRFRYRPSIMKNKKSLNVEELQHRMALLSL